MPEENKKKYGERLEDFYDEEDYTVDFMKYVRILFANWKKIMLGAVVGAVLGVGIAVTTPRRYTSYATLAPELSSKATGSSSLSSLASLAGISLSSSSSGSSAITPTLFPDIIMSNPFIVDMFSLPVEFSDGDKKVSTDLYEYFKEYVKAPLYAKILSLPGRLIDMCKGLLRGKSSSEITGSDSIVDPLALTRKQDKIASAIRKCISIDVDKKTYVVSLSATAQNPEVSRAIADEIIRRLNQYVSDYKTAKSRKDLEYYQKICDEARDDYYASQSAYAAYQDANQGIVLNRRMVDAERLSNEVSLKFTIYNSLSQQVKKAEADVQRDRPMFSVINPPVRPNRPSGTSRTKILFIWTVLGAIVASCVVLLVSGRKDNSNVEEN